MARVKLHEGIWFPDGEEHIPYIFSVRPRRVDGKLTHQYHKLEAAVARCRQHRVALDCGAHVGLWSMHLQRLFGKVLAFEPHPAHRMCFHKNVDMETGNVDLRVNAVGETPQRVGLKSTPGHSANTRIVPGGDEADMIRIDDLGLETVDLIKLDLEGYELAALRGAKETLERCRPLVIVEQKPGVAQHFGFPETGALDFLTSLGAGIHRELGGDYIMEWAPR